MLVLALLLVPTFAVEAQEIVLPAKGNAQNLAEPGSLTLSHTHGGTTENGVPVRGENLPNLVADSATDITVTRTNSTFNRESCSIAWGHQKAGQLTFAPSSTALGTNFVVKFTMQWSTNSWKTGGFDFQIGGNTVFTVHKDNNETTMFTGDYWQNASATQYVLHVYANASDSALSDVDVYIGTEKVKTVTGLTLSDKTIVLKQTKEVWGDTTNLTNCEIFTIGNVTLPTYDPETDSITINNLNIGRALAYTDAPAALAGKNYVMTFTTATIGWSNNWALNATFAKDGALSQSVAICDNYIAYIDANGKTHQIENTATNSAVTKLSVFVRQEENNTCGIYIYQGNTLIAEFDKQQALTPTLRFVGPEGADAWDPVLHDIAMYATAELYGDVNGDGTVAANDATVLAKYLAGWDGYDKKVNLSNADMDQDGQVTPLDEMALHRYLSNWNGYDAPYIPTIVVTDRGVDNTGKTDMTDLLTSLHATGKRIYYPNGTYLFNGRTIDLTGGVAFESQDGVLFRNSVSDTNILNFDDSGNLIGLMQNHLEYEYTRRGQEFVKTGNIIAPPISTANYQTKVDFVPFWYNDFGRQCQTADGWIGGVGWYDWSWVHHGEGAAAKVTFAHNGDAQNIGTWTISNIKAYKPQGSDVTKMPAGATNGIQEELLDKHYGQFLRELEYDGDTLSLGCNGAEAEFTLSAIDYTDEYVIQFTTKMPNAWQDRPIYTISTGTGETFRLYQAGLSYRGSDGDEVLKYAQSAYKSSNTPASTYSITYTLHVKPNGDGTRTVTVYADGQKMLRADGSTAASFTNQMVTESNYDAMRHPLLGWYFGDEQNTLDWQTYWLREYGINNTILLAGDLPSDPNAGNYWAYNLLNNVPNAQYMKFGLQVGYEHYGQTETAVREAWWSTFNAFYFNDQYKDQVYCYEENGKRYAVMFMWDEESTRGVVGNVSKLVALYKDVAAAFKDNGYDGVAIWARRASLTGNTANLTTLDAAGVKWMGVAYPNNGITHNTAGYAQTVDSFDASKVTADTLFGVATSMHSRNHTSPWVCPGANATDFGRWIAKAVAATNADASRKQIVTCYNIAEWAEGGHSLQPTAGDRFDYLKAVRDNIVVK